ncbi:RES family NAD+ phosphorylase [Thalassobaculum sp.]|uniref:RES family NAD+ phosphorylase n=1 Tax=Thalassobaculum sp. TaxID=2022740 RepID=UPI0032EED58B
MSIPLSRVEWRPCWRIIPSRFPPIGLFERVADPGDLDAVFAIEGLTNPRLRDEVGDINLVPPEDRVSGPGTTAIMAAFTHLNPAGSRFSDGSYGVYYAAGDLDTAIAETVHHRARFLAATREPRTDLDMRVILADLAADARDLRGLADQYPEVYRADEYAAGQALARTLRASGAEAIAYDSVRNVGGECAAVLRPRLLSNCRQGEHLCYVWDGARIAEIYEKRSLSRT